MKMKIETARWYPPEGVYVARFDGAAPYTGEPILDDFGKELPRGLVWQWTVALGDGKGNTVSTMTGQHPTPGNSCGRMLAAVCGVQLKAGVECDPATKVGHYYALTIESGRVSDKPLPKHVHDGKGKPAEIQTALQAVLDSQFSGGGSIPNEPIPF